MEREILLSNTDGNEKGRLFVQFKLKSIELEQRIDDDQYELEKIYYDPFETDESKIKGVTVFIKKKVVKIEKLLANKQKELKLSIQQLNEVKSAQKAASYELAQVKITKSEIEESNLILKKEINALDELSELHIQIDILKQSPQGVNLLKEKLAILLNRLELEREYGSRILGNYVKLQGFIEKQKEAKEEIQKVKDATVEMEFNIKRCEDQLPIYNGLKETMKSHERIIANLEQQVQRELSLYDKISSKESEIELQSLKYDHSLLLQKHEQLQALISMNNGILPLQFYKEYKDDPYIQESDKELKKLKEESNFLMNEIEKISKE